MIDFLIQATLSNLVVSTILAVIAWRVQRHVRSPGLANLLWALVLIKMITPPLVALPVVEIPSISSLPEEPTAMSGAGYADNLDSPTPWDTLVTLASTIPNESTGEFHWANTGRPVAITSGFACVTVSSLLCLFSFARIIRFHWKLVEHTHKNDQLTETLAYNVAREFGLKKCPKLFVTKANVVPFVWWIQGRSAIVVPEKAILEMARDDLRLVIAHEMAHIRRGDHWFRWVEWLALISLWWNPVMWWARKQLRITEELACDELVLETVGTKTTNYANSLLNMAELLVTSAIRPPVVASAINSGGNLEKRLKMIIDNKSTRFSSGLRAVILAVATCLFPLGLVAAQDFEAVERRLGLAVHEGELSLEQAHVMMEALKRTVHEHERGNGNEKRHEAARRIVEALLEAGVQEDSIDETIEVIRKLAGDIAKQGNSFEIDDEAYHYLADKLNLNERQIDVVVEIAERLADSNEGEGDNRKRHFMSIVERVKAAVERGDMSEEEADRKLREIRKEMFGGDEEDKSERKHREEVAQKIVGALSEAGVQADSIEATIEVIRKLAADIANQGNSFKLDERVVDYLSDKLNLSDRQIDLVVEIAERLADSKEDDGDNRKDHFKSIVERVKAAVDRGDISEAEAKQKLRQIREEMSNEDE